MNILDLYNIQRVIFCIIFILLGIYLILALLKEIYLVFVPAPKINDKSPVKTDQESQIITREIIVKKSKNNKSSRRKLRKKKGT